MNSQEQTVPMQTQLADEHSVGFFQPFVKRALKGGTHTQTAEWVSYDALMGMAAIFFGFLLTPKYHVQFSAVELIGVVAFSIGVIIGGNVVDLYERQVFLSRSKILVRIGLTTGIGLLTLILIFNTLLYSHIGRWILVISACIFFVLSAMPRFMLYFASHLFKVHVLFIGDSSSRVYRELQRQSSYHLVGVCNDHGSGDALADISQISALCRQLHVDQIIISTDYMNDRGVLDQCFTVIQAGCVVTDECTFLEAVFEQVPVEQINESWFHSSRLGMGRPSLEFIKRRMDIVLSSLALLILSPVFLVLWIAIRLTSPGPAIYRQVRCGRYGHPYVMYKFRTMRLDAEQGRAVWAKENDPRVTAIGNFLRRSRLDELPQFWNVLRGDMSIVGPRPERPELVEEIQQTVPFYTYRNWLRPGITGLAQIRFRYGASAEDARMKLQHDFYYIKNVSVLLDIQILLRTLAAIAKGAR